MPRAPAFRLAAIADLLVQLEFAPVDALRRHVAGAERLLSELDTQRDYPLDFVVFRVTGYRPDRGGTSEMLAGTALRRDLATLVLRLSERAPLRPEDRPGGAATLEAIAARASVSPRTLRRWRDEGLVQHWIAFPEGPRIGCFAALFDAFAARRGRGHGAGVARIGPAERQAIVAEAAAIVARDGGTLSGVARRIATARGRAHESIRQVLQRHDAAGREPLFRESGPLDDRARTLIDRAVRLGVPMERIARRLGRSVPAVHRQLALRRRERLVGLRLRFVALPTFELPDADEVILAHRAVRSGLQRLAADDAAALVTALRSAASEPDDAIEARIGAWNRLKQRCAEAIGRLPAVPTSRALDGIETELRWAGAVQQMLVRTALAEAVRRADAQAGRRIELLPAESLRAIVRALVVTAIEVVDRVDPSRGARLDRLAALEADKALARLAVPAGEAALGGRVRAAAGAQRAVPIDATLLRTAPWQPWLDLPAAAIARLDLLGAAHRDALARRHGLAGERPWTIAEIARERRVAYAGASRLCIEAEAIVRRGQRPTGGMNDGESGPSGSPRPT